MKYDIVIDADGHIMEPFEMWQEYVTPAYRDAAWKFNKVDGKSYISVAGHTMEAGMRMEHKSDIVAGIGDGLTPSGYMKGNMKFRTPDEVHPSAFEPNARLKLMDEMGIDVSVLYPTFMLMGQTLPDGLRPALYDAYERWIADFCSADPKRLKWVAMVPRTDCEEAVSTVERAATRGACGVFISSQPTPGDGRLLIDRKDAGILSAIVDHDLPLGIHVTDGWTNTLDLKRVLPNRWMWDVAVGPLEIIIAMVQVFGSDVLERFPTLKLAFLEGNVGWFPYLAHKMEEAYEHFTALMPAPEKMPLDIFRERCWISGEIEEPEMKEVIDLLGADRCLWATDYPHFESVWQPLDELNKREDISDTDKNAMVGASSIGFYGFRAEDLPHGS